MATRRRESRNERLLMRAENLRTVSQLVDECPAFSEGAIRKLIMRAPLNGLEPAIVRLGRRVLIDYRQFNRWLEGRRGQQLL